MVNTATANNAATTSNNNEEENFLKISLVNQAVFVRKRRSCPLKDVPDSYINYKNLPLLNKFLSERGKIASARITNLSMRKQRVLAKAIKQARQLALLSPIANLPEEPRQNNRPAKQ